MLIRGFLIVLAIVAATVVSGVLEPVEWRWLDQQYALLQRHAPLKTPDDVVVVGIDDASLKEFGVPIATLHRQVGGLFQALALARARAVGLDTVLPAVSFDKLQPGLDAALGRGILMLRSRAPLVLGIGANPDGSPRPLHPLFATLTGPSGQGSVFLHKDHDGTLRRFNERIGENDQILPTLAGQLARRLNVPVGAGLIPMHWDKRFGYVPIHQVLAWQAAGDLPRLQAAFGGKVVMLGSLLAHDDQQLVPIPLARGDTGQTTHGVFVHALAVRGLLTNSLIQELSKTTALALALLLTLSWWLRPGLWAWLGVGSGAVAIYIGSLLLLQRGWAIPAVSLSGALLSGLGSRTALAAWRAASERRLLRQAFGASVSPGVMGEILAGRLNPNLAGERIEVCVLFSDIRSFTTLSEHLPPETVMDLLNRYFERMTHATHRHGGTVDKFIGDGLMAFFGAPQATADPCGDAFRAAQEMLRELDIFNAEQQARGAPQVAIGIGLHYGPASIGYIGSKDRHEYSAIGDTVNAASRLEGASKGSGYIVIMSSSVVERLTDKSGIARLGEREVKGRAAMEMFGWKPPTPGEDS